jgi:hypothetical protein
LFGRQSIARFQSLVENQLLDPAGDLFAQICSPARCHRPSSRSFVSRARIRHGPGLAIGGFRTCTLRVDETPGNVETFQNVDRTTPAIRASKMQVSNWQILPHPTAAVSEIAAPPGSVHTNRGFPRVFKGN